MFVRRLVSGVRSSCDASATSWLRARVDSSRAPSIVLKLLARRLSSSRPSTSIRSERSPVSVTVSVASVSRRTGASAARETIRPSPPAMSVPPVAIRIRSQRIRARAWSVSSSGRAIWTANPGWYGKVMIRTWLPPTRASV